MKKQVLLHVLGASAYPELAELIRDMNAAGCNYHVAGLFDDDPHWQGQSVEGVPVLGPLVQAGQDSRVQLVFGIGSHRTRLHRFEILNRLNLPFERFETLIHPEAKVYSTARVGYGTILHCGSVVANGTEVGPFSVILFNSVVGANNRIGPGALLASHVVTNSRVKIGASAFLASSVTVAESVKVGSGSLVGLGSVVFRDVPPGAFVLGNPPRVIEKVEVPLSVLEADKNFDSWMKEKP